MKRTVKRRKLLHLRILLCSVRSVSGEVVCKDAFAPPVLLLTITLIYPHTFSYYTVKCTGDKHVNRFRKWAKGKLDSVILVGLFQLGIFYVSTYDMDHIYTVQQSALQGDSSNSPRGLRWNCFGIQAIMVLNTSLDQYHVNPFYHHSRST